MFFSLKESLEDSIIRHLLNNEAKVKDLQQRLLKDKINVTSQGIYKILKYLISQEIIIKYGQFYSLNEEWRNRAIKGLNKNNQGIALTEGEKISFYLNSLIHLDQQWKNVVLPLHQAYPQDPIFLYNPHEIWIHLNEQRKISEYEYYASFAAKKIHAFCVFGGNTIHETIIKKELQNEYMQVAIGVEYFSKTDYLAIFNDYIVTTKLSKPLTKKIEDCYQSTENMAELEKQLQMIGIEKKKTKLTIERNREKAKKLRKRMSKQFFVPKELIKDFNLY
ncbi:MAG: hypothetical protein WCJ57_00345 [Candidatus Falkowbacteria bacterium]